ncbi:uncharacterized protein SPSC_02780 [Sporisorium scitamineum]|uniref:CUE domain-containing protein n=1 Tax=Sporisorium scitamineum TaxID=49012 RepID=A0A127ZDF4_9BASI|nr:uncharacterized protein SPSC_02780 [Sporisorium scitamineum]
MSEPVQKDEIDLKSLDQALNDGEAASEVPAETLQKNSDTLTQPPAEDRSSVGKPTSSTENAQKASSPATLSPSSLRAMSPAPAAAQAAPASDVPPAVAELKAMFPDLDNETIAAVLSSRGGDQEAAVNALLQMSDLNFKPTTNESRTDSDALLAQSIAMEEEQKHHEHLARRQQQQQQQQQHFGSGRGGGGAGSFFSGLLNPDARESSAASTPSYDPNALTYQPRVRRGAPAQSAGAAAAAAAAAAAGARTSYAPPNHPPPGTSPSYHPGDSVIPGMPGAKEAKQWREEINRMAETGLARAASTFSSFRQKASAAFNNPQDGTGQPGTTSSSAGGASTAAGAGAGFAQAFQNFRNNTGRGSNPSEPQQATAATSSPRQFTSPRSPHAIEYDQDPSPVSENELAKIISRGGAGSASSNPSTAGKARALAERYGLGIKNANRAGSSTTSVGASGASDYAGWEQAGRTPISITDNTTKAGEARQDSVALMDTAGGRGVTSPRLGRSPSREGSPVKASGGKTGAGAAAVGAGAVGATGAGAAAVASDKHDEHDPNDDSDDLEYVSNPFEDED